MLHLLINELLMRIKERNRCWEAQSGCTLIEENEQQFVFNQK